jgi:hypothetical protein
MGSRFYIVTLNDPSTFKEDQSQLDSFVRTVVRVQQVFSEDKDNALLVKLREGSLLN